MYSLVKYDNGEYCVVRSKRVQLKDKKECLVKHVTGGKYRATLCKSGDTEMELICFKRKLEHMPNVNIDQSENPPLFETVQVKKEVFEYVQENDEKVAKRRSVAKPSIALASKGKRKKKGVVKNNSSKKNKRKLDESNNDGDSPKKTQLKSANLQLQPNIKQPKLIQVSGDSNPSIEFKIPDQVTNTITLSASNHQLKNIEESTAPENTTENILNDGKTYFVNSSEDCKSLSEQSRSLLDFLGAKINDESIGMNDSLLQNILNEKGSTMIPQLNQQSSITESSQSYLKSNDEGDIEKSEQYINTINTGRVIHDNVGNSAEEDTSNLLETEPPDNSTDFPQASTPVLNTKKVQFSQRFSDIVPVSVNMSIDDASLVENEKEPQRQGEATDPPEITVNNNRTESAIYSSIDEAKVGSVNEVNANTMDGVTLIESSMDQNENMKQSNATATVDTMDTNTNTCQDSDYIPEKSDSESESEQSETSLNREKNDTLDNGPTIDISKVIIPQSKLLSKYTSKRHFCIYCSTLQTKFARHLILKHSSEEAVKRFIHLPPKCKERVKIIDDIRVRGDYKHNTDAQVNTGILIVSRRRQEKYTNKASDYTPCPHCKCYFSKKTLRLHYVNCDKNHVKGDRGILTASRRMTGYIHPDANEMLRRVVFPVFRDDQVSQTIRYDRLLILYANKMCNTYTLIHQHDMIRSSMRLVGRLKIEIKKIDTNVTEFISIFRPQRFDSAVKALKIVAKWVPDTDSFNTPAVAQHLCTLMKKIGKKLRTECIKTQDQEMKKNADFLLLWEEEIPVLITKKALDDQINQKRQKLVILPSKSDIKLLYNYVKNQATTAYDILSKEFKYAAFKLLNESTLILIQIFNRRRAGEIERLKLADFNGRQALDDHLNPELGANISIDTREYAKQYTRMTIRGKLNRPVPVLLLPFTVEFIEMLLRHRKEARIDIKNEYLFGRYTSNPVKKEYIRACPLLRQFADDSGAVLPSALRGTTLRKQIATYTAMLDVESAQVEHLADFMGHHTDIHKRIYRVLVPVAEITEVSRMLVGAMGGGDDDDAAEIESDEDCSDSSEDEYDLDTTQNVSTSTASTSISKPTFSRPGNSKQKIKEKTNTK